MPLRLLAAAALCVMPAGAGAQEWLGTVTVGGFARRVYIPDINRPVKAALITNFGDPAMQGRPDVWLHGHPGADPALAGRPHPHLVAVNAKWNMMQMHWIGRPNSPSLGDSRPLSEEYNNILASLRKVATDLGKPEIEHTGIFLEGVSGTGYQAGEMAKMDPTRFAGVLKHHYSHSGEVASGMPCLYVVGGLDTTNFDGITLTSQMSWAAPRARNGEPFSLYLEPGNGHDTADPDHREFIALWLDAIIELRFPATIPTTSKVNLRSLKDHRAWVGSTDSSTDINQPWNRGTRPINNVILPYESYTGTRPYIWLPTERVAQAWKLYMDNGNANGFPDLPPLPTSSGTTATVTAPAAGATFASGASITAIATTTATSGSITSVAFYDNGALVGTDANSAGGWSATWTITGIGAHALTATATNSNGETSTSSAVTVQVLRPADNPGTTVAGVNYAYYESGSITGDLPDFAAMTPVRTGSAATFDITAGGPGADHFAFRFTGYLAVTTGGAYKLLTNSDDGSRLYIGNTVVVDNGGPHGAQWAEGTIALAAGKHAITVDFAENTGGQSLIVRWQGPDSGGAAQDIPASVLSRIGTADTTPPPTPGAPTVTPTGTSTVAARTVSGTSPEAGAVIRLFDNGTLLATPAVGGNGAWTYAHTFAVGAHSLTVTAQDGAGNTSTASAATAFTVQPSADTTPPPTPGAPAVTGSGSSRTIAGTTEANATVRVYDGGNLIATITANGSGAWTTTVSLAAGAHTLTVTAADTAGNTSPHSPAATVIVPGDDTTPPATPSVPTVSGAGTATPTLSGTTEAGAVIRIYDGGVLIATTTADGNGAWSVSITLDPGNHTLTVTATDVAGNTSAPSPSVRVAGSGGGSSSGGASGGSSGSGSCGAGSAFAVFLLLMLGMRFSDRRRR